jgi:hypothetical protein
MKYDSFERSRTHNYVEIFPIPLSMTLHEMWTESSVRGGLHGIFSIS